MTDARRALRELFGFDDFRRGQEEAVAGALAGRDVLVVMPTGAGKSLCYQLPALLREDLAIVVSPLVSLMQDQVEALRGRVGDAVALVNAQQDPEAYRAVIERARRGELRLLYVAPERFSSPGFLDALRDVEIGLFVVDEAHCVSQWGHDFRPDYFRLADAARWLGAKALIASTATATPQVAADIERRLALREPVRIATGFDRPNLTFAVVPCRAQADVSARLVAALREPAARPAIVYAGTRAQCEQTGRELEAALGCEVAVYHAGLARERRATVQRRFMDGDAEVVVATNAFGMGVDKADVRTVAHVSVPASLEAWYQEAGRAGRDGLPARALLLAQSKDKGLHVFFIERAELSEDEIDRVAGRLLAASVNGRVDVDARSLGVDPEQARAIVGHLVRAGVLRPVPAPVDRVRARVEAPYDGRARSTCRTSAADATRARWRQYRSVWAFVEGGECRRATILRHFGDPAAPQATVPCCDTCSPEAVADVTSVTGSPARRAKQAGDASRIPVADVRNLDQAILDVVVRARPAVGRTRAVEILRGGRSKVVEQHGYDGLPAYGAFAGARAADVLARVDELLDEGRLVSTGGRFPKLTAAA
jgi:ATP-dependent DNA helicase RecQ